MMPKGLILQERACFAPSVVYVVLQKELREERLKLLMTDAGRWSFYFPLKRLVPIF